MTTATETKTMPRLKERYRNEVIAKLREQFAYGNPMQVPGLVKIVVNMGVGEAARDAKLIDGAVRDQRALLGGLRDDRISGITEKGPHGVVNPEVHVAENGLRGNEQNRQRDRQI